MGWAGKHTQGGTCCLSCWVLGCPLCWSPSSGPPLSPGVVEHVTASLQTAMGSTQEREQAKRSRKHQEKVPTPRFGTSCTSLCQMAGATSQGSPRSQRVPGLALTRPLQHGRVWPCQAPACTPKKSKSSISSSAHAALGRVAGVDLPLQATGPDQQTPLLQCPVLSMGATNSHRLVLPKKAPGTWVVSFSRAGAEPKSHHCHQGEKNPAVRTSETKKDASLGCFFSIRFFFFYEKRSHGVLQQTECQKNCFKQNINKTKQKDKNLALLSSRLSEISLCSIEGSGF